MLIKVDSREKNSLILSEIISQHAEIEIMQLEVADYIIGDIAIERKTVNDFVSSMINKRLLIQLQNLQQYPKRILIIEGVDEQEVYNDSNTSGIHPNAIRGMILSTILDFDTPIIFTKDYADSAKFLVVLAKRFDKKKGEISLYAKRKARSISEQQQFILEGFPGIGPATAKELLKKFKTLKAIANAQLNELEKIKKMNSKKARIFNEILNKKYKL